MRWIRQLLFGVALLLPVAPAHADDVGILAQRLVELEARVRELDIQLKPQVETADAVTRRLIDAQVLYELKSYEAAAAILLDLVEKHPESAEFPEALYYLADSLYLKRDFLSARRYYERTVDLGARGRHYQTALERLIELSLHVGDYGPVDSYLEKLGAAEAAPGPNSSVPYVKGKYYFFRQRYADSLVALEGISRDNQYWFQAQYFVGACKVAQQRFGEAVQTFDALVRAAARNDTDKRVQELAHMALGRVYYDQGQLSAATAEYGKITQKSDLYVDALYEGAWVSIKDRFYQKAYRSLDLLLTMNPDAPTLPEVKLLIGNLQIRQGEWDAATRSFTSTRDQFEVVRKQMKAEEAKQRDSIGYFRDLLQKNLGKFDFTAALPPSAVRWVQKDPQLDRLSGTLGDLSDVRKAIAESDDTIARLEKALEGPGKVNIFPELANARTRALEAANRLMDIKKELVRLEHELIDPVAGAERAQLEQLAKQRQSLETQLASLPRGAESYQERMRRARSAYDELDRRAVELNVIIASYVAERVAIEKYFHDTGQDADPEKKAVYEKQIAEARQVESELVARQEQLRHEIAEATQSVGVDDAQMQQEEALKKRLEETMAQEHALVETVRARLDGAARAKANEIESLLARAAAADQAILGFNQRIDQRIEERTAGIKLTVAEEKSNVARYKTTLGGYQGEASDVGAGILAQSFKDLAERFYQIVVRADVGIIDVAWALKQTKTNQNSRLVREKKRELRLLDDEFKEVLRE